MVPAAVAAYVGGRGDADRPAPDLSGLETDGRSVLAAVAEVLELTEDEASHFVDMWFYNYNLLRDHQPDVPYDGGAVVLQAATALDEGLARTLHLTPVPLQLWSTRFTGPVAFATVPGDHLTCMGDPVHLKATAVEFMTWLDATGGERSDD